MRRLMIVAGVAMASVTAGVAMAQSSAEIYQRVQNYMDTDRNGVISRAEFDRYWTADEPGSFDSYDLNRDGGLSGGELQRVLETVEEYADYECGGESSCLEAYLER